MLIKSRLLIHTLSRRLLDYDRNIVKALAKKLAKETDEVSTKLDQLELTTLVDHEPKYDMNDTLEDIVVK